MKHCNIYEGTDDRKRQFRMRKNMITTIDMLYMEQDANIFFNSWSFALAMHIYFKTNAAQCPQLTRRVPTSFLRCLCAMAPFAHLLPILLPLPCYWLSTSFSGDHSLFECVEWPMCTIKIPSYFLYQFYISTPTRNSFKTLKSNYQNKKYTKKMNYQTFVIPSVDPLLPPLTSSSPIALLPPNNSTAQTAKAHHQVCSIDSPVDKSLPLITPTTLSSAFGRIQPKYNMIGSACKQHLLLYWEHVQKQYPFNSKFTEFVATEVQGCLSGKQCGAEQRELSEQEILECGLVVILNLINNGNLGQFDRNSVMEIFGIDNQLKDKVNQNTESLDSIFKILNEKREKKWLSNKLVKRGYENNNQVEVRVPNIFPFAQIQLSNYFTLSQSQQEQEKSAENNLQEKMGELFQKTRLQVENKQQQQARAEISILLKQVETEFEKKSIFVKQQFNYETDAMETENFLHELTQHKESVEVFLYDIIANLYRNTIKQSQLLAEVQKLAKAIHEKTDILRTLVAISAQPESVKLLCSMVMILKEASYQYLYDLEIESENPTLIIKQYLCDLNSKFFEEKVLMGANVEKNFKTIANFLSVLTKIDQILKKLEKQKYLQLQIPREFILLCRWIGRASKIVREPNLHQLVSSWIELNKKIGFYESLFTVSYEIFKDTQVVMMAENSEAETEKQLQDLSSFIGSKVLYFWYRKEVDPAIQDEDEEKAGTIIKSFCEWLFKFCDVSKTFAESICLTLNQVFMIEGIPLKELRAIDDEPMEDEDEEDESLRVDPRIVNQLNRLLNTQGSNLSIALDNYAYYHFNTFENLDPIDFVNEWQRAFAKIKNQSQLTKLSSIFNFAFCKVMMKEYIEMINENEANEFTNKVNEDLAERTETSVALGIYGLKCLRKKCISLNEMKVWIEKQAIVWMLDFNTVYDNDIGFSDPPAVNLSKAYKELIDRIILSNFSQAELNQLIQFNQTHEELYWTISTIMKHLYTTSRSATHERVKQTFNGSNLSALVKRVIGCYCDKFVTSSFKMPDRADKVELEKIYYGQFPQLNILNWFVAVAETQNPLVNSFVQNGEFPQRYGEFLNSRHLICGRESPFRRNLDYIVKFNNRDLGVYKCSRDCDSIFTHAGCGFPAHHFDCHVCKRPSGGSHNLRGIDRGARRLGACLYMDASKTRFNRDRHDVEAPIGLSNLPNVQSYWSSFPIYLAETGIELSNKSSVRVEGGGDLKLTGFTQRMEQHELDEIQRIGTYTREVLRHFNCTLMYFIAELKWVSNDEIVNTFGKATNIFVADQLEQANRMYSQLSAKIDQISPWFCGVTREVFTTALNYHDECTKLNKRKQLKLQNVIDICNRELNVHQGIISQMIREVIIPDMQAFKKSIKYSWSTVSVHSRENFEQIVDSKIESVISGQNQLEFIQKVQKTELKSVKLEEGDFLLLEIGGVKEFSGKYPLIRHISLVRDLPHQKPKPEDNDEEKKMKVHKDSEVQEWLESYLPETKQYPLLNEIIRRPEITGKLKHYRTLLCFLSKLINLCDRKITRQKSKQELICDFFRKLPEEMRDKWIGEFKDFKEAWQYFLNSNGKEVQYNCKVLGKFDVLNENSKLNQFLPDTKEDVRNPVGMFMHYALMLIAKDYNEQLLHLYKYSSKLVSKIKLDPSRVTPESMVGIDLDYIKLQIETYTNYGCSYGKTVGKVTFAAVVEAIEEKFLSNGYYLEDELSKIRQITFQGENMLSDKYTTCLEQLKRSRYQKPLDEKEVEELSRSLIAELAMNEEGFYNKARDCLDSLQIVMIYYQSFLEQAQGTMKISDFIFQRGIRKQVSCIFEDRKLSEVAICNLIALYELIEDCIAFKAEKVIPEEYKSAPEEEQWKICVNYIEELSKLQGEPKDQISLKMLYTSANRLILRRMLNFNASMTEQTVGFSLTRLDFWPTIFTEESLYEMAAKIPIKVTQFFAFYTQLKQKIEAKSAPVLIRDRETKSEEVVKKQEVQENNIKKKANKARQAFKKAEIDA